MWTAVSPVVWSRMYVELATTPCGSIFTTLFMLDFKPQSTNNLLHEFYCILAVFYHLFSHRISDY